MRLLQIFLILLSFSGPPFQIHYFLVFVCFTFFLIFLDFAQNETMRTFLFHHNSRPGDQILDNDPSKDGKNPTEMSTRRCAFVSLLQCRLCAHVVMPHDSVPLEVSIRFRYTNELSKNTYVFGEGVGADSSELVVVANYRCPKYKRRKKRRKKKKIKGQDRMCQCRTGLNLVPNSLRQINRAPRCVQFETVRNISRAVESWALNVVTVKLPRRV